MEKAPKVFKFDIKAHICENHNRAHFSEWRYVAKYKMCDGCPLLKCCPLYFRACAQYDSHTETVKKGGSNE